MIFGPPQLAVFWPPKPSLRNVMGSLRCEQRFHTSFSSHTSCRTEYRGPNGFCLPPKVMMEEWENGTDAGTMFAFHLYGRPRPPPGSFELIEVEIFASLCWSFRENIPRAIRDRKIRIYALGAYHTPTGNIK